MGENNFNNTVLSVKNNREKIENKGGIKYGYR